MTEETLQSNEVLQGTARRMPQWIAGRRMLQGTGRRMLHWIAGRRMLHWIENLSSGGAAGSTGMDARRSNEIATQ